MSLLPLVGQHHCQHKPLPLHIDDHGTLKIKEKEKHSYLFNGQTRHDQGNPGAVQECV